MIKESAETGYDLRPGALSKSRPRDHVANSLTQLVLAVRDHDSEKVLCFTSGTVLPQQALATLLQVLSELTTFSCTL